MKKRKITELNNIVKQVPEEKRTVAASLVEEIKFMSDTLEELKGKITEYGTIELYENGKQKFLRENPAVKSYNTMIQRYATLYKQLADLLPKGTVALPETDLLNFMNAGEE